MPNSANKKGNIRRGLVTDGVLSGPAPLLPSEQLIYSMACGRGHKEGAWEPLAGGRRAMGALCSCTAKIFGEGRGTMFL